ncbi:cold-shock protein [Pediococcus pentosaceus]|uniref:cold-shock protein n=1 Tax=Pediococcus pentosaceus TaxID=1255 RepID=UPI00200DED66|nr:cold shock domain-containing protein [Pediococcus pentosaceus]UQB00147.1 cold shock domain-containing protein [Pediococcus pentosaceus]UQB01990.1 cold shock domain-containing protein [Pediococcus pentosaceus]
METGTVESFDKEKGYGFIEIASGDKVFAHYTVIQSEDYKTLEVGEKVKLMLADGPKGLIAVKVFREEVE